MVDHIAVDRIRGDRPERRMGLLVSDELVLRREGQPFEGGPVDRRRERTEPAGVKAIRRKDLAEQLVQPRELPFAQAIERRRFHIGAVQQRTRILRDLARCRLCTAHFDIQNEGRCRRSIAWRHS